MPQTSPCLFCLRRFRPAFLLASVLLLSSPGKSLAQGPPTVPAIVPAATVSAAASYNWVQASPASQPPARAYASMAYDAATGTVVLFGGFVTGTRYNDTWTWDGTNWTQQSPATSPPARNGAVMAYDAATRTLILFGGYNGSTFLNDTWSWNGTNWTQLSPGASPTGRLYASMAYDSATGLIVLFGGEDSSSTNQNDTWTWNGTTWTQQSIATSPSARWEAALSYDEATQNVVLFGGQDVNLNNLADTWTGTGTSWTQRSPATSPTARAQMNTAYDSATASVVLFGGLSNTAYQNDTWTWNGTTWSQQTTATTPSARRSAAMAFDPLTNQVVLFGGYNGSYLGDTWNLQSLPSFGTVAVGSTVSSTAAFTVTVAGGLGTPVVLTQGAPNLDFTLNTTGTTCTGTVSTGNCTVVVNFRPTAPGLRMGAVEVVDVNNNVLATTFLQGIGAGPQITFTPGTLSTVAGTGTACSTTTAACGDGSAATASGSNLNSPYGAAVDGAGNLYIADTNDHRIRKVTAATGILSTVAGTGTHCASSAAACGDGSAATASGSNLYYPKAVAVDGAGNLYIADSDDHRIRKVTAATGILSTVAGTGTPCSPSTAACGDGSAATASGSNLNYPFGVAVDGAGNLYIADTEDHRIRKVTAATGILSTVAGVGTQCSPSTAACGDGSAATATGSNLNFPQGLAVDSAGNLYIADTGDHRIRKVTAATGILSTVAGTGTECASSGAACGDGSAATASGSNLNFPNGVAVDGVGNLYIADFNDNRIRRVTAATGILSTIGGTGTQCSSSTAACGDGSAATATGSSLNLPGGVAVDGAGNLYIADINDNRIRKVTASAAPLNFPNTAVNATSATQTVTVNNIGNAALTLSQPGTGQNPSLSSNFTLSNSSTCPIAYTSGSVTIAAGSTCTEILSYTPAVSGAVTGNLIFTDNSLNVTGAAQSVALAGSTTSGLTMEVVGQNVPQGTSSITLEFTVGYGGNTAPTGTPTLTVNGSATNVGPVTCKAKAGHNNCTATYNPSSLAPGAYTISATQPADATYTSPTTGTATLTITGSAGTQVIRPIRIAAPLPAPAPGFAIQPAAFLSPMLSLSPAGSPDPSSTDSPEKNDDHSDSAPRKP